MERDGRCTERRYVQALPQLGYVPSSTSGPGSEAKAFSGGFLDRYGKSR
jgi:hypothetical protein